MVKRIVGYDDKGEKLFDREARDYDKRIAATVFGITLGDIVKAVPVIAACVLIYSNNEHFKQDQLSFNKTVLSSINTNAENIAGIKNVLTNLNNYLSSATGKQFKDGIPYYGGGQGND